MTSSQSSSDRLMNIRFAQDAGVIDQHMHLAERGQRCLDDAAGRFDARDVVAVGQTLTAGRLDFGHHGLGGFAADVIDHDVGALGCEGQRVGAAKAAAGAGNDDGTSVTDTHFALSLTLCLTYRRSMMVTLA